MSKKLLVLLAIAALSNASSATAARPGKCGAGFEKWDLNCDGKLDYKESIASGQAYRDQAAKVYRPAAREGLPEPDKAGYPNVVKNQNPKPEILYYNPNGLRISDGRDKSKTKSVRLSKNISDYRELRLTYRLQAEDVGVHTRNMTINTDLWHVDPSHSKWDKLYRYAEQVGVDKNRWDSIHFWRIAPNRIWVLEKCDSWRWCGARLMAVEGIK
ncbi:hypothetical protein BS333_21455 (plasmid) [Vibrio azureus]|uniref:EF-hand domain-containing protein n=1 Tax=Vibrio azureus NBRC 104587 TaxID=1219077 RepID=U3AR38_9VIBR|nr:hypothetical protein [Vibrio azureus]AUI88950.1 hypothetical protein BS333_21455 [Vibrio azureus]GAD76215.1 hypothetical protein VAZ01S_039_00400 [Vibrio azureus NBRC 104587]